MAAFDRLMPLGKQATDAEGTPLMVFAIRGDDVVGLALRLETDEQEEKERLYAEIERLLCAGGYEGAIFQLNGWFVSSRHGAGPDPSVRPSQHPDRRRCLAFALMIARSDWVQLVAYPYAITRDGIVQWEPPEIERNDIVLLQFWAFYSINRGH